MLIILFLILNKHPLSLRPESHTLVLFLQENPLCTVQASSPTESEPPIRSRHAGLLSVHASLKYTEDNPLNWEKKSMCVSRLYCLWISLWDGEEAITNILLHKEGWGPHRRNSETQRWVKDRPQEGLDPMISIMGSSNTGKVLEGSRRC